MRAVSSVTNPIWQQGCHTKRSLRSPAEVASCGALGFICCTCAPASSVIVTLNANGAALMLIMQIK